MQRRKFLATTTGAATTVTFAGCGGSGGSGSSDSASGDSGDSQSTETPAEPSTPTETSAPEQPDVEILSHEMVYDDTLGAKVQGGVRNTTESTLSYIEVSAKFYNNDGTRVGEGMWNATDVEPKTTVQFETIGATVDSEPAEYEIETSISAL